MRIWLRQRRLALRPRRFVFLHTGASLTTGGGVTRAMRAHSLACAKERFRAMQFNFVIATNERTVRLRQAMGFDIVSRLPGAFAHPAHGCVDALVMWRRV